MYYFLMSKQEGLWESSPISIDLSHCYPAPFDTRRPLRILNVNSKDMLEGVPALLMYEKTVPGLDACLVRHGRLKNIALEDDGVTLNFNFEPDTERAYFNRRFISEYSDNVEIIKKHLLDNKVYCQWVDGDIPPSLLDNSVALLPVRTLYRQSKHDRLFFKSLRLTNFLSFGADAEPVELRELNVLIGPNGAGKSNFIEAFSVLQASPENVARPILENGSVRNWLYRGQMPRRKPQSARLEAVIGYSENDALRYALAFDEIGERFQITDELLAEERSLPPFDDYIYYQWRGGSPVISMDDYLHDLSEVKLDISILAQKRDRAYYRELTDIGEFFGQIKLYREWTVGPNSKPRSKMSAGLPSYDLATDASNLGIILNNIRSRDYESYQSFLESLRILYPNIRDVDVHIDGGGVQIFIQEINGPIPASRLSDGTLRFLFLLAILYDISPPPLICIEEPELGMHPDVLPTLARLLVKASERTQLIVTTHSPILIDALSETPEYILVCEQTEEGSTLTRLDAEELRPWLENYRLGDLWMRGNIGGTRW